MTVDLHMPVSQSSHISAPAHDAVAALARAESLAAARQRRRTAAVWGCRILVLLLFVGLWEWGVRADHIDPFFFTQPSAVWAFLVDEFSTGDVWTHIFTTLRETIAGFAIGAAVGMVVGLLRVQYRFGAAVSDPFLTVLNVLPRVALAPMFIIWFGLGEPSKIALAVSLVFFIMMINTEAGIKALDRELFIAMRAMGATDRQLFWKVMLPGAVPAIFSGLRLGVVYALLAVVVGEMIAARAGLGQRIAFFGASFRTEGVIGTILILATIGLGLNAAVSILERRLLRWRGEVT